MIWKVFAHIALALKECHKHTENGVVKPILHRDIKPGNIFLDAQVNNRIFSMPSIVIQESYLKKVKYVAKCEIGRFWISKRTRWRISICTN